MPVFRSRRPGDPLQRLGRERFRNVRAEPRLRLQVHHRDRRVLLGRRLPAHVPVWRRLAVRAGAVRVVVQPVHLQLLLVRPLRRWHRPPLRQHSGGDSVRALVQQLDVWAEPLRRLPRLRRHRVADLLPLVVQRVHLRSLLVHALCRLLRLGGGRTLRLLVQRLHAGHVLLPGLPPIINIRVRPTLAMRDVLFPRGRESGSLRHRKRKLVEMFIQSDHAKHDQLDVSCFDFFYPFADLRRYPHLFSNPGPPSSAQLHYTML
mmetsp:Transcript_15726/g.35679  ORF Transcript_15726/g.35679 Transcript_15726/m.35679 type:complete len:261 (-) Transcript_15726:60-842(-)